MKSTLLTCYLYIIGFYAYNTLAVACRNSEYLSTAGECCPMCQKGYRVLTDCVGDSSTSCMPCTKGTFMKVPNGLHACRTCKTCDRGLYISQNCSTEKDTECEVLDGYYCAQSTKKECYFAMEHSVCKPGEQIKTPGTRFSDTVCATCPPGFYSPEGVRCFNWTDCLLSNEIVDEEGTSFRDVKCKPTSSRSGLIVTFVLIAAIPMTAASFLLLLLLYWKVQKAQK